jgi:hypothetical protein
MRPALVRITHIAADRLEKPIVIGAVRQLNDSINVFTLHAGIRERTLIRFDSE